MTPVLSQIAEAIHAAQQTGVAKLSLMAWSIDGFSRVLEAETLIGAPAGPMAGHSILGIPMIERTALRPGWVTLFGDGAPRWLFDFRENLAQLGEVAA